MTQVTQQKLESVSVAAALVLFVAAQQEQESFVAPFYNPPSPPFTCYFGEDIRFLLLVLSPLRIGIVVYQTNGS